MSIRMGHALMITPRIAKAYDPLLVPVSAHSIRKARLESRQHRSLSELILSESQSGAYHRELHSSFYHLVEPSCRCYFPSDSHFRWLWGHMRSYLVLREALSNTSSQVAENQCHCRQSTNRKRLQNVQLQNRRMDFCNQRGIGEHHQQSASGKVDSQRHSLQCIANPKRNSKFSKILSCFFKYILRKPANMCQVPISWNLAKLSLWQQH